MDIYACHINLQSSKAVESHHLISYNGMRIYQSSEKLFIFIISFVSLYKYVGYISGNPWVCHIIHLK